MNDVVTIHADGSTDDAVALEKLIQMRFQEGTTIRLEPGLYSITDKYLVFPTGRRYARQS